MELLKKLRHPNIVTYVDAIRTEKHLHILLEYMENGKAHTHSRGGWCMYVYTWVRR